jgi:LmbE family N-acetylglucosaminyl deacetylase
MNLYLSPHCDDAILSCGALMAQQRMAGEAVVIVSICTASPTSKVLSPLALAQQVQWDTTAADIFSQRRAEDRAACVVFGVELIQLDELDCIYRRDVQGNWLYEDESALFGNIHPNDTNTLLQAKLENARRMISPTKIYAPLAIGNHIDHQRSRQVAECWHQQGIDVLFYEDYPYVEDKGALWLALNRPKVGIWQRHPQFVSKKAAEMKIETIQCYHSQLSFLFKNSRLMCKRVMYHMRQTGNPQLAEVVWRLQRND